MTNVNTATVISDAMTAYVLASGTNKAPAAGAPAHVAAWLESRGYRIVRSPALRPVEPGDLDQVTRLVELVNWHSARDDRESRRSVVLQILALAAAAEPAAVDTRMAA